MAIDHGMKTKGSSEHEREDYFELIPMKNPILDMSSCAYLNVGIKIHVSRVEGSPP